MGSIMETFLIWTGAAFWATAAVMLVGFVSVITIAVLQETSEIRRFTTRFNNEPAFTFKVLGFGFLVLPAGGESYEWLDENYYLQKMQVGDKVVLLVHPWRRKK